MVYPTHSLQFKNPVFFQVVIYIFKVFRSLLPLRLWRKVLTANGNKQKKISSVFVCMRQDCSFKIMFKSKEFESRSTFISSDLFFMIVFRSKWNRTVFQWITSNALRPLIIHPPTNILHMIRLWKELYVLTKCNFERTLRDRCPQDRNIIGRTFRPWEFIIQEAQRRMPP